MCKTNRETVTLSDAGWSDVNKTSFRLAYLSLTFEHLNVGLLSHRQNKAEKYLRQLGILETADTAQHLGSQHLQQVACS